MLAVYIDPAVCHTWLGWVLPECYGIAVQAGIVLTLALTAGRVRRWVAR